LTLDSAANYNGETGSLWVDGGFIFSGVVIIVNLKVLFMSREWTFFAILWSTGSIASYMLCFYGESAIVPYKMFGVFDHIFMFAETYATLFFAVIALLTIDVAIFSIDLEVKSIREQKAEMEEKRLESLRKSSRAVSVKKKFNPFESKLLLLFLTNSVL